MLSLEAHTQILLVWNGKKWNKNPSYKAGCVKQTGVCFKMKH